MATYSYEFDGGIVPRTRPRIDAGFFEVPLNYRQWREKFKDELIRQSVPNFTTCAVDIILYGKHSGNAAEIIDAVVNGLELAGVVENSRLSTIARISFAHAPASPRKFFRIHFTIL